MVTTPTPPPPDTDVLDKEIGPCICCGKMNADSLAPAAEVAAIDAVFAVFAAADVRVGIHEVVHDLVRASVHRGAVDAVEIAREAVDDEFAVDVTETLDHAAANLIQLAKEAHSAITAARAYAAEREFESAFAD